MVLTRSATGIVVASGNGPKGASIAAAPHVPTPAPARSDESDRSADADGKPHCGAVPHAHAHVRTPHRLLRRLLVLEIGGKSLPHKFGSSRLNQ